MQHLFIYSVVSPLDNFHPSHQISNLWHFSDDDYTLLHWKSNYEHFLVSHAAGSNVRNTKKKKNRNTSAENIQISDSIFGWIIESLTDRIIFHMESTKYALDSDHK